MKICLFQNCQLCQKQCRDENGFKMHVASESHIRQMILVGQNAGQHIADFSAQFQSEFVTLLSRGYKSAAFHSRRFFGDFFQKIRYYHVTSVANDPPLVNLKRLHSITTFPLSFLPQKNTVSKVASIYIRSREKIKIC